MIPLNKTNRRVAHGETKVLSESGGASVDRSADGSGDRRTGVLTGSPVWQSVALHEGRGESTLKHPVVI